MRSGSSPQGLESAFGSSFFSFVFRMEEMRAQLQELMNQAQSQGRGPSDFTSPEVCKFFLTGLCPHDLVEQAVSSFLRLVETLRLAG